MLIMRGIRRLGNQRLGDQSIGCGLVPALKHSGMGDRTNVVVHQEPGGSFLKTKKALILQAESHFNITNRAKALNP